MDAEVAYILNTFSFLICGFLVMWMAAGFLFLESGLVTTRSVSTIAAKNIGKFAICSLIFLLFGYNMAYGIPDEYDFIYMKTGSEVNIMLPFREKHVPQDDDEY